MNPSFSAFIVPAIGLVISLAGLIGLVVRRGRFRRGAFQHPVCPECRYPQVGSPPVCSECGADLSRRGVIDASWPRPKDWVIRAVFVLLFLVPLPVVLGPPVSRMLPAWNQETVVSVIAVGGGADGALDEVLLVGEERRWFDRGISVLSAIPKRVTPRVWYALPPEDASLRMTGPDASSRAWPDAGDRASLGDGPYRRRRPSELTTVPAGARTLADELVAGGGAAASGAYGRSRAGRGTRGRSNSSAGNEFAESLESATWMYGPVPTDTYVPVVRNVLRSSRAVMPEQGVLFLGMFAVVGLLLLRGFWLMRRFRPRPVAGDPSAD